MAHTTSRLAIPVVDGTDNVSSYPPVDSSSKAILDNAATYKEGTLVNLGTPAAAEHGRFYYATDKPSLQWNNGTNWQAVGLIPSTTASSVSVASGQCLITTGGGTPIITLPTLAKGQRCAVVNFANVTVVAGVNIQGVGLSSATALTLGVKGASATFISDGTNWYVIGGGQDTGWITVTLVAGVVSTFGTCQTRLIGDRVWFRGGLWNTTGGLVDYGAHIATVAAGHDPSATLELPVSSSISSSVTALTLFSNGQITIGLGNTAWNAGETLQFEGISYWIGS